MDNNECLNCGEDTGYADVPFCVDCFDYMADALEQAYPDVPDAERYGMLP